MKINGMLYGLVAAILVIFAVTVFLTRPVTAEEKDTSSAIMAKLDEILANQKAIAQDMASLKEEVNIVKIRVTQIQ